MSGVPSCFACDLVRVLHVIQVVRDVVSAWPDPATAKALATLIESKKPTTVIAAARALGTLGLKDGIGPLIDVFPMGADEPVRHAAFSSYPSSRGSVQTALVVSSRRIFVAEQLPDAEWTVRTHDRTAVTGLEIDAQGIGEATIGLVAGEQITDQLQVARLDRMDLEDAAPFVSADAEDGGALPELEPLPPSDDAFDAPPALEAIPLGHKIALVDLEEGATVLKYGHDIGHTVAAIRKGGHVHVHNTKTTRW